MGKKTVFGVTTGVLVLGGLFAAAGDHDGAGPDARDTPLASQQDLAEPQSTATGQPAATEPAETAASDEAEPERPEPDQDATAVTVVHVVDGDTVYTSDGGKIRLIGYDTPETGECGFDDAKAFVASLVLDQRVEVVNPGEVDDADKYDRDLRYIRVGGEDLGTAVLEAGLANARYDGLDGYDRHPLQDEYRAISDRVEHRCADGERAGAEPEPQPDSESGAVAEADEPWNQPGPDLDCADIGHPVRITGQDFHRLDRDGDGWACESS